MGYLLAIWAEKVLNLVLNFCEGDNRLSITKRNKEALFIHNFIILTLTRLITTFIYS